MLLILPDNVKKTLNTLQNSGFEAYAVGGCVRDMLMGITPHDYDVTTSALPEQVQSLFEKTIPTGIKHGTVTVIADGMPIEVTTFRTESGYSDSRRPDSVNFVTDIKADLSRRDFTTNAIAYNDNGITDPFGGINDIKSGILRAVGEPKRRFTEDALRILRLFRFSSQLGFTIDIDTFNAALDLSDGLQKISRERISAELEKAVCGKNTAALLPLISCGALDFLSIKTPQTLEKLQNLPIDCDLRLFSFFYICRSDINQTCKELKFSNARQQYFTDMEFLLNSAPIHTREQIKSALKYTNIKCIKDYALISEILNGESSEQIITTLDDILAQNEPYLISHLAVSGNEILQLGIHGKEIGNILEMLLSKVIKSPALNNKDALLQIVKEYRN